MKSFRMTLVRVTLAVMVISLSGLVFAQSEAQKPGTQKSADKQSDSQKAFEKLKALAGSWEGKFTTVPKMEDMGDGATVITMRVTSRGNALVHEITDPAKPDDPTRYDHPLTMFYLDGEKLLLTHYCDAGNRPRMVARTSPDGKTVEFDFLDVAGDLTYGHMQHAVFTFIDADHHTEEWTFLMPGDKPLRARIDLQRKKAGNGNAGY